MTCGQPLRRTKIVATIGPSSNSPAVIRRLILAGMDVARLNFSHGSREEHARTVSLLRETSRELDTPVTILQDLQGPKIRVSTLPGGQVELNDGEYVTLLPESEYSGEGATIPIDYPYAARDAENGTPVLLADGLLELKVETVRDNALHALVVHGGVLKSRKGVNFPTLNLRLPSLTPKDEEDLDFGLEQNVDAISLSFVRGAHDVRVLKDRIASKGARKPVIAKIEKPQALENLESILAEARGVMVARGDLGIEISPEKVPMLQKRIIEQCNRRGLPVITATQMLESMVHEPRPTRAETSDVANAIIDGTDAVMLSGESAMGKYPVKAVEMMARIAAEVESAIEFKGYQPQGDSGVHALARAANVLAQAIQPKCIAVFTETGLTALSVAAERLRVPVIALTTDIHIYHALNLVWGIKPLVVKNRAETVESLTALATFTLTQRGLAGPGDIVVVLGKDSGGDAAGANFIKVHALPN